MKKSLFFVVLFFMGMVFMGESFVFAKFSDVSSSHANADAIEYVQDEEIVSGYPDGTYKPDKTINRAEFTKIIVGSMYDQEDIVGSNCFPDVNTEWFAKYVCLAKSEGIISGYPDGTFQPAKTIAFSEASKIITQTLGYEVEIDAIWYKPYVLELEYEKAIPTSIKSFSQNITRGEMAEMIYRLMEGMNSKSSMTYAILAGESEAPEVEGDYSDEPEVEEDTPEEPEVEEETPEEEDVVSSGDETWIPLKRPQNHFSKNSFWNTPLPSQTEVDPLSDEMVRGLEYEAEYGNGFLLSYKAWTSPVYYADENTPRYDVPLVIEWLPTPGMVLKNVPIPTYAKEDESVGDVSELDPFLDKAEAMLGDGPLAIIDTTTDPWTEYDFWQARQVNESGKRVMSDSERVGAKWIAGWGNRISLGSDGIFECGLSARGSGNALSTGLIWPEELKNGKINHKLGFSFTNNHEDGPREPFTENDGWQNEDDFQDEYEEETESSEKVYPIPEGAIVQLDPSLNLDTFRVEDTQTGESRLMNHYEKTIAKALQEYGMVNFDNGGAVQLYLVHENSFEENPYPDLIPQSDYVDMPVEWIEHFHVVKMAPEALNDSRLTEEEWSYYSCNGSPCELPEWDVCE